MVAQAPADGHVPICVSPCASDPGGASLIHQCYRASDGHLYLFHGAEFHIATPAPAKYDDFLRRACDAMGIGTPNCSIHPMIIEIGPNAVAGECEGQKMIFFDDEIETQFGEIGAMFVILHEVGHHACGHLDQPCTPKNQLLADAFAGAGLRFLGVSYDAAKGAASVFGDDTSNQSVPVEQRARAVTSGWSNPSVAKKCDPLVLENPS